MKKVQRGTFSGTIGTEYSVTLEGFTNLDKMVAIVSGGGTNEAYVKSLSIDKLVISVYGASSGTAGALGWQVIEFD